MNKLEQAARQVQIAISDAVNALLFLARDCEMRNNAVEIGNKAITALREALAEQAEQEPEVWYCPDCGTLSETQVKCCPDWIRSRKVTKNFAITCKATFDRNGQAEQKPVAWRVRGYNQFKTGNPALWRYVDGADKPAVNNPDCCDFEPLYAAPVHTKDLTDDEIAKWFGAATEGSLISFARAVIEKFKEKNRG